MTATIAKAFAEKELDNFRVLQERTYQSDFDRLVAETSDNLTEYLANNRCCYNHRTLLQKLSLTNPVSENDPAPIRKGAPFPEPDLFRG